MKKTISRTALKPPGTRTYFHYALTFLCLLLIAGPISAAAQSSGAFRLAGISVEGAKRFEPPEIVRAAGLKISQPITLDELKEAAEKLGRLGVFSQVNYQYRTQGSALTATFTVQDAERLFPCTFANFVWFTPEELLHNIQSQLPLFNGNVPLAGTMLDLVAARLASVLASRGLHAQVLYEPQQASLDGPVVAMRFREAGVPLPVRKVDFSGVTKVDVASLQQAARPLIGQDYDGSYVLQFCGGSIGAVYHRHGYLRVQCEDPAPHLIPDDPTPNAVAVTIPVSEGEQYRLKEITWSGESVIPYSELAKSVLVAVGSPLDAVELEQDVLAMVLLFHPKGYIMADLKSNTVLDDATHEAVCQIQVHQGDLFRLGRLEIAGLDDAHARAVEKKCRLHSGDPYDGSYWNTFQNEVSQLLPASSSYWKLHPVASIHADTKTVDVRLIFSEGLSRE